MEFVLSIMKTVLIFGAAIFILVLIHELGHFLTAKLFGMRVDRFSIGFPPRVFGIKKGDTDYCISATPLGGYVKIAGMIDESMDDEFAESEPQPWEYRSKPVWQRMIVISAGVIFNMILAWVIYSGLILKNGAEEIPAQNVGALYIVEQSLAWDAGFRTGDELVAINGTQPEAYRSANLFSITDITSKNVVFSVKRGTELVDIQLTSDIIDRLNTEPDFISLGNALPSTIGSVVPGTPAEKAGLKDNDKIIRINGTDIGFWVELTSAIRNSEGDITLVVDRSGELIELSVTPNAEPRTIGIIQVDAFQYFGVRRVTYGVLGSLAQGALMTTENTVGIVQGLARLFSGDISLRENLGGPLAIASVTREATDRRGAEGFWMFTAFLSITLAIMNLLPIPVLDGGHLVFLGYEAVMRREPSIKTRMILQQIGMVFIIGLMIFVTLNDILRFFGG